MMLMMGVAGALQRGLPDAWLVEQFVAIEMALALLGGFAPLAIHAAWGLLDSHFALVLYLWVMALGFLIGFELPLVLRINARFVPRLPSNLGFILALDYVGGFVGAIIWARYLLRELPLGEISFLIAGFNFVVAAITFVFFARRGDVRHVGLLSVGVVGVALALAFGFASNRAWSDQLEQRLFDDPIVFAETTRYQRIVITHSARRDDTRMYLNGNLQLSSVDEEIYHEQLVHPAMSIASRRARVLILGGGDGLALREVLDYPDVELATLVDLDPRMTQIASTMPALVALNEGAFDDARVQTLRAGGLRVAGRRPVFHESDGAVRGGPPAEVAEVARVEVFNVDAARFVEELPGLWDVVLIDFPDPSSIELAKLYSLEFYRELRGVLDPEAVVALQATSPYHAREAFLCIQRTLEAAGFETLAYQDDVPSFGAWGWILARPTPASPALAERIDEADRFDVETGYLTPELMRASRVFGRERLTSEHEAINTLMRPALLDFYLHESWLTE